MMNARRAMWLIDRDALLRLRLSVHPGRNLRAPAPKARNCGPRHRSTEPVRGPLREAFAGPSRGSLGGTTRALPR